MDRPKYSIPKVNMNLKEREGGRGGGGRQEREEAREGTREWEGRH